MNIVYCLLDLPLPQDSASSTKMHIIALHHALAGISTCTQYNMILPVRIACAVEKAGVWLAACWGCEGACETLSQHESAVQHAALPPISASMAQSPSQACKHSVSRHVTPVKPQWCGTPGQRH